MTPGWDEWDESRPTELFTDESEHPAEPGTIEDAPARKQIVVDVPDPIVSMAQFAITACGLTVAVTLIGWGALAAVVVWRWLEL